MATNKKQLLLLGWALSGALYAAETEQALDQTVAIVNKEAILMSEAQQQVAARQIPLRQAIDELIVERLQVQQARGMGIPEGSPKQMITALRTQKQQASTQVSEQEVADLIASQSDTLTQGERYNLQHILIATPTNASATQAEKARKQAESLRKRIADGEDFTQIAHTESDSNAASNGGNLGWQAAEKLPASFTRAIAVLNVGEVSPVIRDDKGFHLLKLLERAGNKQKTTTAFRTRHILISTDTRNDAAAKEKIENIYQQLAKGGSFSQLAQHNSDDPGSAAKGGDLGWVVSGQTVSEFEQVMQNTADNGISKPFKTQYGWHILQVLGHKQDDRTAESLQKKARRFLTERKAEEQYQAWLQSVRSSAFIEYHLPSDNNLQLH